MIDRFYPGGGTPDWNPGCFEDGRWARINGQPSDTNPHLFGSFAWRSWRAGWADEDMAASTDTDWPGEKEILL